MERTRGSRRGWTVLAAALLALCAPAPGHAQAAEGRRAPTGAWVRWAWQRTDLLRYNRVEGLSVGVRAQALPRVGDDPLSVGATLRVGSADRVPGLGLDVVRETLRWRLQAAAYRELAASDEGLGPFGVVNSLTALLLGRDDGDYYRRAGASLTLTPPSARPRAYRLRAHAERHGSAPVGTRTALPRLGDAGWRFRPNLEAREGWEAGLEGAAAPWWGTDPLAPGGGLEATLQAVAGDWSYLRATAGARALLPLAGRWRLDLSAAAGAAWGELPPQRLFAVGGPLTLRGFAPRTLTGPAHGRARAVLSRRFPWADVGAFADGAWAGERDAADLSRLLASTGLSLAVADGRLHADAAWGIRGPRAFRLEVYLDATP